jgi:hypothetical protein
MRDRRASAIGLSLVTGAAFVFVCTAGVDAQRRRGNDNSAFGAPVATNTIVDAPDQYFGKLVTITAGVERMVSKTTFLMDQQKVAGPKEVKAVGKPILVIAPYLTSSLDQKKYFLVRGQVVKLEPSALAKLAPDYVLDLPQEVGAKYMGQPVLVASSVLNSTYAELAKKPIPPPTQDDLALTAAMKTISPAFNALRTAAQESKADVVRTNLAGDWPRVRAGGIGAWEPSPCCGHAGARCPYAGGIDRDRARSGELGCCEVFSGGAQSDVPELSRRASRKAG